MGCSRKVAIHSAGNLDMLVCRHSQVVVWGGKVKARVK